MRCVFTSLLAVLGSACIIETNPTFALGGPTETATSSASSSTDDGTSSEPAESSSSMAGNSSSSSDSGGEGSSTGPVACSGGEVRRSVGDGETCYAPDPSLRAWWSFEGETLSEALVDEIDGHELLVYDGARDRTASPLGQGLVLETPYYALLPSSDTLWSGASPTQGTLQAWVWLDPSVEDGTELPDLLPIVYFGVAQGDGWGDQAEAHLHIFRDATDPTVLRWRAGMHVEAMCGLEGADVQVEQWVHLAATWTPDECKIYVDGVETGTAAVTGALLGDWTVAQIGMAAEALPLRTFRGVVDEIMIFDQVRSAADIAIDCADCGG